MEPLKLRGLDDYKKEELEAFWKDYNPKVDQPKILGVSLSCSDVCNLRCIYCYAGKDKKPVKNELNLEEQNNIISQSKELGGRTVILCGDGEPSMDKNLVGIAKHAKACGMILVVVTNAVIFGDDATCMKVHNMTGEALLKELYDNDVSLIIKLESLIEEKYEYVVGVKGTYKKYREAINRIVKIGFGYLVQEGEHSITRFAFSSVIMKNNIEELNDLKKFADSVNAQYICKLPSLVGNALDNMNNMFEVREYEEIRKNLFNYTAKRETLMVDTPRCMAWHYGPCISILGEIRECYTSPFSPENRIGNVRENSLRDLILTKNKKSNIQCGDFCPVKTRINKEFEKKGMEKVWKVIEECCNNDDKIAGF
jgi:MoaA/NifB/PqqE/SkfB family radical SAM enzyme